MTKALRWILPIVFAISGCGAPDDGSGNTVGTFVTAPERVRWTPPSQYTDESIFNDLSKYRLYYGPDKDSLKAVLDIDSEGVAISSYVFSAAEQEILKSHLSSNSTHVFAMTAINSQNIESGFSNIASFL